MFALNLLTVQTLKLSVAVRQEVFCLTRSTRGCWRTSTSASPFAARPAWCLSPGSCAAGTSRRARMPPPVSWRTGVEEGGMTASRTTTTMTASGRPGQVPQAVRRCAATARWPTSGSAPRSCSGTSATCSATSASTCPSSTLYVVHIYTARVVSHYVSQGFSFKVLQEISCWQRKLPAMPSSVSLICY